MSDEVCIELGKGVSLIGSSFSGEILKVEALSFLGDVDRERGVLVSDETGCRGAEIKGRVLFVRKFRGSTVGPYVLYSLCKRGLAPKAIVMCKPDTAVMAGVVLCRISALVGLPEWVYAVASTGDRVRVEVNGAFLRLCLLKVRA